MVYMNNDDADFEVDTTDDENIEIEEPELVDLEEKNSDKLKKMREKLSRCEDEKKQILDDSQRAKADFLNARKRLEEERVRDRIRFQKQHVEELLPLCDSFQMAMNDKEAWEKADPAWRKGVEGIQTQLIRILDSYNVKSINPEGEPFDPHRDEAVGTEVVEDENLVDKVISVVQLGYEIKIGDTTEVIRHARVTIGVK